MTTPYYGKFRVSKVCTQSANAPDGISKTFDLENRCEINYPTSLKKKRKRNGCFCCRKRRIKCQGSKPRCLNCIRSSYICVWPNGDESLPHENNFQLQKVNDTKQNRKRSNQNAKLQLTINKYKLKPSHPKIIKNQKQNGEEAGRELESVQLASFASKSELQNTTDNIQDKLFRKLLIEINSSVLSENAFTKPLALPLSNQNSMFYDAFINGFITDISPQLAHFKLQPGAAFIPSGLENSVVQNLFIACGASFLYSAMPTKEMELLSKVKFNESVGDLTTLIGNKDIHGHENWVIIFLLLAYLKTKFIYDGQRSHTLAMITIIEAIKLWVVKKQQDQEIVNENRAATSRITEINDFDDGIHKNHIPSIINDKTSLSSNTMHDSSLNCRLVSFESQDSTEISFKNIANQLKLRQEYNQPRMTGSHNISSFFLDSASIETEILLALDENTDCGKIPKLFSYERTMLESFICNYSHMLLVCDRSLIQHITSPFVVFDMVRPYLTVPIYRCAVPWMNHPVVGAALPLFELQAKVCWCGLFFPLSNHHKTIVSNIRNTANFYIRPILPLEVYSREPETVQKKLLESCYAAEILAKAIFIYSTKLLYPNMSCEDQVIQIALEEAYTAFQCISAESQVHIILSFCLSVLGTVAIKPKHRLYFLSKLEKLQEVFQINCFHRIKIFCTLAWSPREDGTRIRGWDVLVDPAVLKDLII